MSEREQDSCETSADIADEIRRAVESMGDEMPYTVSAGTMRRVADRIKAAWRREKAEIEANALTVGGVVEAARHTPGNAAAMREALVAIQKLVQANIAADEFDDLEPLKEYVQIRDICNTALSAPARQCDVGTAEEQAQRFHHQCFEHHTGRCSPHCRTLPAKTQQECALKWAQTPYEAQRKGEGYGNK